MPFNDYETWLARDEEADRARHKRQQAELFDPREFDQTTSDEREILAFYSHQSLKCECGHDLGMHDAPPGPRDCKLYGCKCKEFVQAKEYDRFRITPQGEVKPADEEAA